MTRFCAGDAAPVDNDRCRSPSPVPAREMRPDAEDRAARWAERERKHTTQPSRDVIVLGLDPDVDADKLRSLITALADMVKARLAPPPQDVTVIRDRNTGASKGFGFVKFDTLDDARLFVYTHAPFIHNPEQWLGPSTNLSVRRKRIKIDFSNSERPQGGISYYEQHNAPNCKEQLKRARARRAKNGDATETNDQVDAANENAGLRDAAASMTDMLLLTHLRPDVRAECLGTALCDRTQNVEQVLLLRHRSSRASTGRAFVVYKNADAAKAALQILRNRSMLPHGLLGAPDQEPVKTSYGDMAVMEEADPYDPTCSAWVFTDRSGQLWRYEDESLGLDVWDASTYTPALSPSSSATTSPRSSISVDAPEPVATPVPAPLNLPAASVAPVMSHGTTYFVRRSSQPMQSIPMTREITVSIPPAPASSMPMPPHSVLRLLNFADVQRRTCLLCHSAFPSVERLTRHVAEDAQHQRYLNDEMTCRIGAARVFANATPAPAKENAHPPTMHTLSRAASMNKLSEFSLDAAYRTSHPPHSSASHGQLNRKCHASRLTPPVMPPLYSS
ncbi:hypothetical protein MEQU1_000223 [Malassezia equina]|uniref:RRM domain-containing protein n=1 Tax=Malassezia equina TaxID=1381935 RepID=A0AAF0E9P4_9BASI|nr:hypothetical protein MEQU1_000223 [Malassezia equina]